MSACCPCRPASLHSAVHWLSACLPSCLPAPAQLHTLQVRLQHSNAIHICYIPVPTSCTYTKSGSSSSSSRSSSSGSSAAVLLRSPKDSFARRDSAAFHLDSLGAEDKCPFRSVQAQQECQRTRQLAHRGCPNRSSRVRDSSSSGSRDLNSCQAPGCARTPAMSLIKLLCCVRTNVMLRISRKEESSVPAAIRCRG